MRISLAALGLLAAGAFGQQGPVCPSDVASRVDCYPWDTDGTAVTATQCAGHGCCFDNSVQGAPWCFYPQIPSPSAQLCSAVSAANRLDCHPEPNADPNSCSARGCCWDGSATGGLAACFFPHNDGYTASAPTPTATGFTSTLSLISSTGGPFRNDIQSPKVDVSYLTQSMGRVRITDPNNQRYVPMVPLEDTLPLGPPPGGIGSADFDIAITSAPQPFGITVTRKASGQVLFDTRVQQYTAVADGKRYTTGGLVFEDQYLELTTILPNSAGNTPHIYGLAEHITSLQLPVNGSRGQTYTMFARDQGTPFHNPLGATNLYASQPFYIVIAGGQAFGVFLFNSNGMDIILQQGQEFGTLTYRIIGGVFDLFVFSGPTPADVIAQYQQVVGKPRMPPRWALGFHLCRWGYDGVGNTRAVWQSMIDQQMPQESQWNDIDYLGNLRDFTLNTSTYPLAEMRQFISDIHNNSQHYVQIVDPAISSTAGAGNYPPFDQGLQQNTFIKDKNGNVFIGSVWPGDTAFPDFLLNRTAAWWRQQFQAFHDMLGGPDGAWIDMNEPSSFGNVSPTEETKARLQGLLATPEDALRIRREAEAEERLKTLMMTPEWQASPSWNYSGIDPQDAKYPPFLPGRTGELSLLEEKTIGMTARQSYPLSSSVTTTSHYNVHNLYGWSEGIATIAAMEGIRNKRGLVIGRSTFATSGKYQGHWLGDNNSDWPDLYYSLTGTMTFNVMGMPLVGSDVCGFSYSRDTNQPTTPELCTRWMQAAAWTAPFFRNHNTIGKPDQTPSNFDDPYRSIMRDALNERLTMVPYIYTLMHLAHANATPVSMPLFVPFYSDENVAALDTQVMLGPSVMVSPVITQGATTRSVYFPPAGAPWYDIRTGKAVSGSGYQTLPADISTIPVHVRAGSIVPQQLPNMTTVQTSRNPFTLTVALAATPGAAATGSLFVDDGDALLSYESGLYTFVEWQATATSADGSAGTLTGGPAGGFVGYNPPGDAYLAGFRIMGVQHFNTAGSKVTVNGAAAPNVEYDSANQMLMVAGFVAPITQSLNVAWASSR